MQTPNKVQHNYASALEDEVEAPVKGLPAAPSASQQSWGVIVSIVIIVGMIIIGAFYAWGERIAQERALTAPQTEL